MLSIKVEPETGMAIATCSGVLGLIEAKEYAEALWKTPGWLGKLAVWDFREAKFNFSYAEIKETADFISRYQPTPPPARVAWVTQRNVDFGLARVYQVFQEDPRTNFHVFRDYHEAVSWALKNASIRNEKP